ncbi:bifunctional phosphoribosylaminoimidazolecarboxamide formyltransferase/IMP cyclohydrolase [Candidatus Uhrbacteria bacterium]|nr:bifunctional phosphoribosylaminoimidazolecarboxamide formyltransferase/IMP cyclohydrolase [Candidatus Uhrbacteria bacterium]
MNTSPLRISRALLSVSDKTGIVELAATLHQNGVEILSTGGTSKCLRSAGIPVIDVSDYTGFPEIMDGRVKTLHPAIHGGILGRRDLDAPIAAQHGIVWIDLVVCNVYPFSETISNQGCTEEQAREQIDIGGPSMIRSAAKNYEWVCVVVDSLDYTSLREAIAHDGVSFDERKRLAAKAFAHTASYDSLIAQHYSSAPLNNDLVISCAKQLPLRYGENPHQKAAFYGKTGTALTDLIVQHQGKELSYNNILDTDAALRLCQEFTEPACVIVKHTNPCGVAVAQTHVDAFRAAYAADPLSAFGGIIAMNGECTIDSAEEIVKTFFEVVIAPSFDHAAITLFATKKNLRVLSALGNIQREYDYRSSLGGLLVQQTDKSLIESKDLTIVTKRQPTIQEVEDMLHAWKVVKHAKSNAIILFKNGVTNGIGCGLVSRIDSVRHAINKCTASLDGSVLASDAFFPFRDSIDEIAATGIRAVIQPGGSLRDQEVINACNEHGIAMAYTNIRCFRH